MSGLELFKKAQLTTLRSLDDALNLYGKCIKKIMKDEDPLQPIFPGAVVPLTPDTVPTEVLPAAFCALGPRRHARLILPLRCPAVTKPDAHKLLASLRPGHKRGTSRFTSERGPLLLKTLQIIACTTLGILAWDAKDRSTAAKRYREALDVGSADPIFSTLSPASGLESATRESLTQARNNLGVLVANDAENAAFAEALTGVQGAGGKRKEVVSVPNVRVEAKEGGVWKPEMEIMTATDACGRCGAGDVDLKMCSVCKKVQYRGVECQTAHWRAHKRSWKA